MTDDLLLFREVHIDSCSKKNCSALTFKGVQFLIKLKASDKWNYPQEKNTSLDFQNVFFTLHSFLCKKSYSQHYRSTPSESWQLKLEQENFSSNFGLLEFRGN